jgi:hypothetical protein
MFSVELRDRDKVFYASAGGLITREDGLNLLNDLKTNASKIDTKKFNLVIDSKEVKPSAQDTLDVLQQVMDFYMITPFNTKFLIVPKSAITVSQNKRITDRKASGFRRNCRGKIQYTIWPGDIIK